LSREEGSGKQQTVRSTLITK